MDGLKEIKNTYMSEITKIEFFARFLDST